MQLGCSGSPDAVVSVQPIVYIMTLYSAGRSVLLTCCCWPVGICATSQVSLLHRREVMRKEHRVLLGLHELLTYGLKGVAAYAHHAEMLGKVDPELDNMFEEVRGGQQHTVNTAWLLFALLTWFPMACAQCVLHTLLRHNAHLGRQSMRVEAGISLVVGCMYTTPIALVCVLPCVLQVLAFLASDAAADANNVLTMCMRLGDTNFNVMKLLDEGHTSK